MKRTIQKIATGTALTLSLTLNADHASSGCHRR